MTGEQAQALTAARRAHEALGHAQTKDAAWLALYALDLDDRCGLAWSVVARILVDATRDPLGTVAARHALSLGLPDPEREGVERHHRIDLWTKGLLRATNGASLMRASEFDDGAKFEATPEQDEWFEARAAELGGVETAIRAARRMVAAFSDAWVVPNTGEENPLKAATAWVETAGYAAWKRDDPLKVVQGTQSGNGVHKTNGAHALPADVLVLSDHWIERETADLLESGDIDAAEDKAKLWVQLRSDKLRPKAAVLRVLHAAGRGEERDAIAAEVVAQSESTGDLNELEEARTALGELELWEAQLRVLERMETLAPGHPVILANRGVAMIELGDHEAGARELERALEADPDNGPALANLGLEKMRRDDYAGARRLLERAVAVAPDQPQARLYLAACKNNQGDRAGAIADLEQVLQLDPDHKQAKQLLQELRSHVAKSN